MKRFFAARQSYLLALGLALALAAWMLSGHGPDPEAQPAGETAAHAPEPRDPLIHVRVQTYHAEDVQRELVISGRTEPARSATLRAEIDGRVVAVEAARGRPVRQGQPIVRLDPRDLEAQLAEARALVAQRELQHQAAQRLQQRQMQAETAVAEAFANLQAARAMLKRIEVLMANTVIRAAFDGVLDQRPVELGDYLTAGDTVARVLEQDPMVITGHITEQDVHLVEPGQVGDARLVTGERVSGRLRFVAAEADEATRTFRVELEVPNPAGTIAAGVTSEIRIPSQSMAAHFLSPALLSLNDAGEIGVKAVNDDGVVEFHPARIIRAGADGIWVSGLPESLKIITIGHGFVRPGERVRAIPASAIADSHPPPRDAS